MGSDPTFAVLKLAFGLTGNQPAPSASVVEPVALQPRLVHIFASTSTMQFYLYFNDLDYLIMPQEAFNRLLTWREFPFFRLTGIPQEAMSRSTPSGEKKRKDVTK